MPARIRRRLTTWGWIFAAVAGATLIVGMVSVWRLVPIYASATFDGPDRWAIGIRGGCLEYGGRMGWERQTMMCIPIIGAAFLPRPASPDEFPTLDRQTNEPVLHRVLLWQREINSRQRVTRFALWPFALGFGVLAWCAGRGRRDRDHCAACGYSLTGLKARTHEPIVCPECGAAAPAPPTSPATASEPSAE